VFAVKQAKEAEAFGFTRNEWQKSGGALGIFTGVAARTNET
jgi:hypothetical protein